MGLSIKNHVTLQLIELPIAQYNIQQQINNEQQSWKE